MNVEIIQLIIQIAIDYDYINVIEEFLKLSDFEPTIEHIVYSVEKGSIKILELFLNDPRINTDHLPYLLTTAIWNNQLDIAHRLLQDIRLDPFDFNYFALREAAKKNYYTVIDKIIQYPLFDQTCIEVVMALIIASKKGHIECVKSLLTIQKLDINGMTEYDRCALHVA